MPQNLDMFLWQETLCCEIIIILCMDFAGMYQKIILFPFSVKYFAVPKILDILIMYAELFLYIKYNHYIIQIFLLGCLISLGSLW